MEAKKGSQAEEGVFSHIDERFVWSKEGGTSLASMKEACCFFKEGEAATY
jgi:hypothetical protein